MRLAFMTGLILLLVLAPTYLVPHLFRTDSGEELISDAAQDIVTELPQHSGIESVAVEPFSHDYRDSLRFALIHELRLAGGLSVIEKKELPQAVDQNEASPTRPHPDAILTGKIQRHEMPSMKHRMNVEVMVLDGKTDKILWTTTWRGTTSMSGHGREFKKNAVLICLALAAGVLIVFVRREDQKHGTGLH